MGFAARVESEDEARAFLGELRQAHRQARHICHGFVVRPGRDIQRSSDDGEPAGTAGMPILKAIVGRETSPGVTDLSDVVVAVVRYFGGIKLGAGGLVQAYSDTAAATLDAAPMTTRQRMARLGVVLPMAEAGRVETTLRGQGHHLAPTGYAAQGANLTVAVPDDPVEIRAMVDHLARLTSGRAVPVLVGTYWLDRG